MLFVILYIFFINYINILREIKRLKKIDINLFIVILKTIQTMNEFQTHLI